MRFSEVSDGDFAVGSPDVDERRSSLDPRPWSWCIQEHGNSVVEVVAEPRCGERADALLTAHAHQVLAVQTADCVPVLLWSPQGVVAAVHAGWRGACARVVETTIEALRDRGAVNVYAVIGPHIHADAYEFGDDDAQQLVRLHGDAVLSTTKWGTSAIDMTEVTRLSIVSGGATLDHDVDQCTSTTRWWSHRTRADGARLAATIVLDRV